MSEAAREVTLKSSGQGVVRRLPQALAGGVGSILFANLTRGRLPGELVSAGESFVLLFFCLLGITPEIPGWRMPRWTRPVGVPILGAMVAGVTRWVVERWILLHWQT